MIKFTSEYFFYTIISNLFWIDFKYDVFFLEADYDDAYTFAVDRRERLPSRYYERRVLERPLPNFEPAENCFAGNYLLHILIRIGLLLRSNFFRIRTLTLWCFYFDFRK